MDLDQEPDIGLESSLTKSRKSLKPRSSSSLVNKNTSASKTKQAKEDSITSNGTSAPKRSTTSRNLAKSFQGSISRWLVPLVTPTTTASKRKADVPVEELNDLSYAHPLTETMEAALAYMPACSEESLTELLSSTLSLSSQDSLSLSEMRSSEPSPVQDLSEY